MAHGAHERRRRGIGYGTLIMVKHYGDGATKEATMHAEGSLEQVNIEGQRIWMQIMEAIEELQRKRPRDGEAVH